MVKHKASEFGGPLPEIETLDGLLCSATNCGWSGAVRLSVAGGWYVVCKRHAVLVVVMTLGLLGAPNAIEKATEFAEVLGIDWMNVVDAEPRQPCSPDAFLCLNCGGGMIVETVGMYSGFRYVHTCGEGRNGSGD